MTDAQMAAAWQLEHDDTLLDEEWIASVADSKDDEGIYLFVDGNGRTAMALEKLNRGRLWAVELGEYCNHYFPVDLTTRGQVRTLARLMGAELREGTK